MTIELHHAFAISMGNFSTAARPSRISIFCSAVTAVYGQKQQKNVNCGMAREGIFRIHRKICVDILHHREMNSMEHKDWVTSNKWKKLCKVEELVPRDRHSHTPNYNFWNETKRR